jgi:hypothetical protein
MLPIDGLDRWIDGLRDRLRNGDLSNIDPIDIGHRTAPLPAEHVIRIMLADLDDLAAPDGSWRLAGSREDRRRALRDDFRRLRELLG